MVTALDDAVGKIVTSLKKNLIPFKITDKNYNSTIVMRTITRLFTLKAFLNFII